MSELQRFNVSSEIDADDAEALVRIAAKYVRVPNKRVVDALGSKSVFPSVRASAKRGERGSTQDGIYRCDNTSPRYALLWPHGYRGVPEGWRVAHIWPNSGDKDCYTNIANLCLVAAPLERLTDGNGPLLPYLKYNAQNSYGWRPKGESEIEKPNNYDFVQWLELNMQGEPIKNLNMRFDALNNHAIRQYRKIGGMEHWRTI